MKDFFEKYADRIERRSINECWLWTGSRTTAGYGNLTRYNRAHYAHRSAYHCNNGTNATVVRHTCDNPPCVNPRHLIGGTHADNARDAIERGRAHRARGEAVNTAVLTARQVLDARRKFKAGASIATLARDLGVAHSALTAAVTGKSWDHLAGASPNRGHERGEDRYNARLTSEQARSIRKRALAGERTSNLAKEFGVGKGTVSSIKVGRAWRHA